MTDLNKEINIQAKSFWIKTDTVLILLLLLTAGILLFNNLNARTITLYDEAINSRHDLHINTSDESVFFPEGKLADRYYRKFPLKTWLKIPIFKAFGFSPFTFRLLYAVMGLITVLSVFLIGRFLFDRWVGFLGAFTTFSAFSYETLGYLEDSSWLMAGINISTNIMLGIIAAFIGVMLGRAIFGSV